MSEPIIHHYIPRSYFFPWSQDKRSVPGFAWPSGQRPKQIGSISLEVIASRKHLYRRHSDTASERNLIESKFDRIIDSKVPWLVRKIVDTGISSLSYEEQEAWARILLAFLMRSPESMRKSKGVLEQFFAEIDNVPSVSLLLNTFFEGRPFASVSEQFVPGLASNLAVESLGGIFDLEISSEKHFPGHVWWTVAFKDSDPKLITSDKPLILEWSEAAEGLVFILPITPRHVFLSAAPLVKNSIDHVHRQDFANTVNYYQMCRADRHTVGLHDLELVRYAEVERSASS